MQVRAFERHIPLIYWKKLTLSGKKLRVREPSCDTKWIPLQKNIEWMQKFIRLYNSLALTEAIEGRKILCMKLK